MRVLVTGVSGLVGRTTAARLAGAGHDVIGFSRTRPKELAAGVRYVRGDVTDSGAVAAAMDGVDVLVHCAFALDAREGVAAMREVNVGGTQNVVVAATQAGVRRAIFLSSITVYGPRSTASQPPSLESDAVSPHPDHPYAQHKVACEAIFAESGLQTVNIRAGIVLGRGTDNRLQETLAAGRHVVPRGEAYPWAIVHHDDLARFIVEAVTSDAVGTVNVATPDAVDPVRIADVLGRKTVALPLGAARRAATVAGRILKITAGEVETGLRLPLPDVTALQSVWGFDYGWTGAETVEDTRLAVSGVVVSSGKVVRQRGRTPYPHQILAADSPTPDGSPLEYSGPEDLRGEFDTPIDRRFPVYSQTNLAEALPGPSSALTLSVQGRALRGTTQAVAEVLHLPPVLRNEAAARLQAVHAHRMYINGSGSYHVALAMPGSNPDAMAAQFTGTHASELPGGADAIRGTFVPDPLSKVAAGRAGATVGREILSYIRGVQKDVDEVKYQTRRIEAYLDDVESLSDARLTSGLVLAADLLGFAWTVQGLVNLVGGAALALAQKAGNGNLGNGDDLESSATLRGVRALAALAAADPAVLALVTDRRPGAASRVAAEAPEFWAQVQKSLSHFGHRGPGEAEFDARSFSDDVDSFLSTIGRAAATTRKTESTTDAGPIKRTWAEKLAVRLLSQREQNRDRCVRLTWITRRLVLEHGRRLVAAGRIDDPRDLFHLTMGELIDPPTDARELISRRAADRARLLQLHMPPVFAGTWEASEVSTILQPGESLSGIGVCKGTVVGRARVVEPDSIDDLEPDEIMIAHVTDVGYTALFSHVGAVVTDIGGLMSHAAVVAREYGVPCVVDTQVAAARIRTGSLIEVDGAAGTVTVLEAAPASELVDH